MISRKMSNLKLNPKNNSKESCDNGDSLATGPRVTTTEPKDSSRIKSLGYQKELTRLSV